MPNRANLAGFRDEIMRQEVSSGLGHVRVRPRQVERFGDVTAMVTRITHLPSVKAVEPILVLPGAIKKDGHLVVLGVTGVNASACEHPYERTLGADLTPGDDHGVLLGERLAKNLDAKVGDEVNLQVLLSTRPRLVLDDEGVGNYTLTVRGLVGFAALDSLFVNWGFLASETGDDRSASALLVWARNDNVNVARQIASAVEHDFPDAAGESCHSGKRSGWPSRGRWSIGQRSFSLTNRRAVLIPPRLKPCWTVLMKSSVKELLF